MDAKNVNIQQLLNRKSERINRVDYEKVQSKVFFIFYSKQSIVLYLCTNYSSMNLDIWNLELWNLKTDRVKLKTAKLIKYALILDLSSQFMIDFRIPGVLK